MYTVCTDQQDVLVPEVHGCNLQILHGETFWDKSLFLCRFFFLYIVLIPFHSKNITQMYSDVHSAELDIHEFFTRTKQIAKGDGEEAGQEKQKFCSGML